MQLRDNLSAILLATEALESDGADPQLLADIRHAASDGVGVLDRIEGWMGATAKPEPPRGVGSHSAGLNLRRSTQEVAIKAVPIRTKDVGSGVGSGGSPRE